MLSQCRHLEESETERRNIEQQLLAARENIDTLRREKDEVERERERFRQLIAAFTSEKQQLESTRTQLQEQVVSLTAEIEKLHLQIQEARVGHVLSNHKTLLFHKFSIVLFVH